MKTHYGDPCIHCHTPHDEVPIDECVGDGQPKVIGASFLKQVHRNRYYLLRYSDGHTERVVYDYEEEPNLWLSRLHSFTEREEAGS